MAIAVARHAGARHVGVIDVNDYRLALARKMGASIALNVKSESLDDAMLELGMEEGFDAGLEMSSNPSAFRNMQRTMHGGKIALLGIPEQTAIDWKGSSSRG
jgi:threonine 3-dehydrogenase